MWNTPLVLESHLLGRELREECRYSRFDAGRWTRPIHYHRCLLDRGCGRLRERSLGLVVRRGRYGGLYPFLTTDAGCSTGGTRARSWASCHVFKVAVASCDAELGGRMWSVPGCRNDRRNISDWFSWVNLVWLLQLYRGYSKWHDANPIEWWSVTSSKKSIFRISQFFLHIPKEHQK